MEVINKMNEKQLQDKINGTIWSACDTLRSSIPGGNYKDYALVMLRTARQYADFSTISTIHRSPRYRDLRS